MPTDVFRKVHFYEMIWIGIYGPRLLESWCINGTTKSHLENNIQCYLIDLGIIDPDPGCPRGSCALSFATTGALLLVRRSSQEKKVTIVNFYECHEDDG